jgi:hypothetical protein
MMSSAPLVWYIVLQMCCNLAVNHIALTLANHRHIGRDGIGLRAELPGVMHQMRDFCAPNFILAGQAGDVGTRAPYPLPLHNGSPSP